MYLFQNKLHFKEIIFRNRKYSEDYVFSAIDDLSNYLKSKLQTNPPFIFLYATNHIKTVIAYFAILKAGLCCVLIDPVTKHLELNEYKDNTPPVAEIKISNNEKFDYKSEITIINNPKPAPVPIEPSSTLVYTAAEDGYAKAAVLGIDNIYADAEAARTNGVNESSVVCTLLPMHHLYGLMMGSISPMLRGASILVENISNMNRIKTIASNIAEYKVTHLYTIPMIYYLLTKVPSLKERLSNIEISDSGGYKLSKYVFDLCKEKLGLEIHEGYGLTEASPVCAWHYPGDRVRFGSIGRSLICCDIQVIDSKNKKLHPGEIGEVCIKGSNVMKGYYNNDKATSQTIKDSWLYTGDLGKIDKDGFIYLTGLKKNMLNVCGKNVYPAELERLMLFNSNLRKVEIYRENDELQGDIIHADLELNKNNTKTQIKFKKWCFENISNYKIPRIIHYRK